MSQAHDWSWLEQGSAERLRLDSDRRYVTGGSAHRDRDIWAVSTADPFAITVSWEQLDRGFPPF